VINVTDCIAGDNYSSTTSVGGLVLSRPL